MLNVKHLISYLIIIPIKPSFDISRKKSQRFWATFISLHENRPNMVQLTSLKATKMLPKSMHRSQPKLGWREQKNGQNVALIAALKVTNLEKNNFKNNFFGHKSIWKKLLISAPKSKPSFQDLSQQIHRDHWTMELYVLSLWTYLEGNLYPRLASKFE